MISRFPNAIVLMTNPFNIELDCNIDTAISWADFFENIETLLTLTLCYVFPIEFG